MSSFSYETRTFTLDELITLVEEGRIALPDFQRGFVWDPSQVAELAESVMRGWPIGSLLLLEGPQPFETVPLRGLEQSSTNSPDYYLLDGQQRVTSLYRLLTGNHEGEYYVDLDPESAEPMAVRWSRLPTSRDDQLPVSLLWRIAHWDEEVPARFVSSFVNRIDELAPGFVSSKYSVPAIVMNNAIPLDGLTRIFETINRAGEPLDAFDLMVAVLRAGGFRLRDEWDRAVANDSDLSEMEADGVEVLKLIALWRWRDERLNPSGLRRRVLGVRQRDVLNLPADYVADHWGQAISSYAQALRELRREFGVLDRKSIPSLAMVIVLADMISRDLNAENRRLWYWRSIVKQSYGQGANTQVLADARGELEPLSTTEIEQNLSLLFDEPARRNRVLRLGLRGLLIRVNALSAVDGLPLGQRLVDVAVGEHGNWTARVLDRPLGELAIANAPVPREVVLSSEGLSSQGFSAEGYVSGRAKRVSQMIAKVGGSR